MKAPGFLCRVLYDLANFENKTPSSRRPWWRNSRLEY
jgi:hypothetical protein